MYPDTAAIRALAGRLRERADEIRDLATGLLRSAAEVAWDGVAADAMRVHVQGRVAALHRTARLHDDAAEALLRHAREVDLAEDVLSAPASLLHHLAEAL